MCQRNWRQYNANLVQRGSLSFFCHPSVIREIKKLRRRQPVKGRPPYPTHLLLILMLLKIAYSLSYRSCEGMAISLFTPHGIKVPSYSSICRGVRRLASVLPKLSKRRPHTCLIDASGFKISGEGEWKTKVHGPSYHRSWLKVHLVVDSEANEIVDLIVTAPSQGDVTVGKRLLERLPKSVRILFADGAYDGFDFRQKTHDLGIKAVAPPPSNAQINDLEYLEERNDALRIIYGLGGDCVARCLWGKLVGYCHRVKAESAFSRLKRLFSESIFSRNGIAQIVEIWLKALLSNQSLVRSE